MEPQRPRTRILLIDDHALFREGAARLLEAERDLKVAGRCGSVEEALEILRSTGVDLVLLDVDLGKERGFQFFKPARENGFAGRVLVVAAVLSVFEVRRLVQAGAAGVFLKQSPPNLLVDAIRTVMAGQLYIDPALQDYLRSDAAPGNSPRVLTSREQAVLSAVVEGLANKEIAARVHISEALVKATLQQLFEKNGVRTRSQLVRIALEQYGNQL
jgi:two-component system, NarL family, nitrate/nitrite response regulator NarL